MVNDALSELFPMIDVERVPGELLLLMGTRIGHGGGALVGAAGEAPKCMLFNPVDSGLLVTLTQILFSCQTTVTVRMAIQTVPHASSIATQILRDSRNLPPNLPTAQILQESAVALADATVQTRLLANTPLQISDENSLAVLAPGSGFEIGTNAFASSIHFSFWWRERAAEPAEVNL